MSMRVTMQCGRQGSAVHNAHTYKGASRDVKIFTRQGAGSLRERELSYYQDTFGPALEERNRRYRAQRHPERCRTMEQVYMSRQTRPEEVILQIGKRGDTVLPEIFESIAKDFFGRYYNWTKGLGSPTRTLSISMHFDESTPHLHWRRVWCYQDEKGLLQIGQAQALKRSGIDLGDQGPESRYHNRKMVFDQMVREMWQETCRDHGLQIETEPLPSRRHKGTEEYIDDQIATKVERVTALAAQEAGAEAELQGLRSQMAKSRRAAQEAQVELDRVKDSLGRIERLLGAAEQLAGVVSPGIRDDLRRLRMGVHIERERAKDRPLNDKKTRA